MASGFGVGVWMPGPQFRATTQHPPNVTANRTGEASAGHPYGPAAGWAFFVVLR